MLTYELPLYEVKYNEDDEWKEISDLELMDELYKTHKRATPAIILSTFHNPQGTASVRLVVAPSPNHIRKTADIKPKNTITQSISLRNLVRLSIIFSRLFFHCDYRTQHPPPIIPFFF